MSIPIYDVVIVGSGIVGATAALALAKQSQLKIAILEAKEFPHHWQKATYDYRVSAISQASKKIFQNLHVWQSIVDKRISPYTKMHVWDAEDQAEIHFDAADVNESALGFIIEDSVMRMSVLEEIRNCSTIDLLPSCELMDVKQERNSQIESAKTNNLILNVKLNDSQYNKFQANLSDSHFKQIKTRLLIAADGANSIVRDLMGIELKSWDYDHTAIVTTLETSLPHQRTAWQRFLPSGPLAFLPLEDKHQCSIVWSTSHVHALDLLALSEEAFCAQLTDAFKHVLGDIKRIKSRFHFPLRMRHAKNYVQPNVALIGDAAHTIHPLAGQGVNMGLLDAVCLTDIILQAIKKNRDFASFATLRSYERARKSDNLAMLAGVEVLKQLFATKNHVIQTVRNTGIRFTNRSKIIKNYIINYALGYRGDFKKIIAS